MSDLDLLQAYARGNSQAAFAALVERHVNLVYSAAHRQVRSAQLAEEITQSVFLDLSRQAGKLRPQQPLAPWFFVVTRRTAVDVVRRESRRQAREQTAAEIDAMRTPSPTWIQMREVLDEAMEALNEGERSAVILRFFENRSLREVGESLGISEDTAQKRVSRAIDRLRELLVRRGVAVSAAGLATDLSAHAVEAAPVALGSTITSVVTVSGAAIVKSAHTAAITLAQKSIAAAATAAVLGVAVYESVILIQQRAALAAAPRQIESLQVALRQLGPARQAAATRLQAARVARDKADHVAPTADPEVERAITAWLQRLSRLKELAAERTEFAIPELSVLTENEWFTAAREAGFDTEEQTRDTFRKLHITARNAVGRAFNRALVSYADANDGRLPETLAQLAPLSSPKLSEAALARYELQRQGLISEMPKGEWLIAERLDFARSHESRLFVTPHTSDHEELATVSDREFRRALHAYTAANSGQFPREPMQLVGYFLTPPMPAALTAFLARPAADFSPEALRTLLTTD